MLSATCVNNTCTLWNYLRYPELCSCHLCTSIALSEMDKQLKPVDYSDSESETEEESPAVLHGAETFSVRDSQGRQVAIVEPTPQNVAVVHPMDSSAEEDLEGSGIFEPDVNDPLSTQATHGSSSPADKVDPYFIS